MRNSKARCMGRLGSVSWFLECERSSMSPTAGHDKFADGLACPRRQLSFSKVFRESFWVAGIANGDRRNRIPAFGNSERLPGLVMREACHLVNQQAA